jgi:hypothetical protein
MVASAEASSWSIIGAEKEKPAVSLYEQVYQLLLHAD